MSPGSTTKPPHSKPTPFYKQGWFVALVALVTLAGAIFALSRDIVSLFWKPHGPFLENVEIVLDRSKNMALPFEGKSKLESAVSAMQTVLRNQGLARTNLAYREFGGDCGNLRQTPPTVPFRQDNAAAVQGKADDLVRRGDITAKAKGEATLVDAINQAVGDFSDTSAFGKVSKRVIVITGDIDACNMPMEEVRASLARLQSAENPIEIDFKFIAVGVDKSNEAPLVAIAEQTKGTLHFVYDQQQLNDVLHDVIVEEPGQRAADATRDMLDLSVHRLDLVTADLDKKDYASAQEHLRQAHLEFDSSEIPIQVLGERQTEEKYHNVFAAAQNQHDIQQQLLVVAEAMLSQARNADETQLRASREQYNKLIAEYNEGTDNLIELLAKLRDKHP